MELSFAEQTLAFGYSVVLGAALAVLYGVIKFFRFAFSFGKAAVVACDVAFMLIWALCVFYFSLAFLRGSIRVHIIIGSGLGFALWRLTAGRQAFRLYRPVVRFFRSLFQKICRKLKIYSKYLLKIACGILYNISRKKDGLDLRKQRIGKRKSNDLKKAKNKAG